MTITADLEDLTVAEFMMMLAHNRKTGQLTIERDDDRVRLAFRQGDVVYAASTAVRETVGAMLIRRGLICDAELEAVRVLQEEPEHNKKLWENTAYFKRELASLGFNTGYSETPIVPAITGPSDLAVKLSEGLWDEGVYALPIVFPMVARDAARIRNMMNAGHTKEDLNEAIAAYEKVGKHLGII